MQGGFARAIAILGAILGWAGLGLQLFLTLVLLRSQDGTALDGIWRYLGYFTVIANIFAAFVLTLAAIGRSAPRREFAAATAMVLIGVTYSLLLRQTWNPQGLQKLADIALHDAMPLLVALFWLLRPHGALGGRDLAACMILPLAYCLYALARGAAEGWYPYDFLDLARLGAADLVRNCLYFTAGFLAMACGLLLLDRALAARRG